MPCGKRRGACRHGTRRVQLWSIQSMPVRRFRACRPVQAQRAAQPWHNHCTYIFGQLVTWHIRAGGFTGHAHRVGAPAAWSGVHDSSRVTHGVAAQQSGTWLVLHWRGPSCCRPLYVNTVQFGGTPSLRRGGGRALCVSRPDPDLVLELAALETHTPPSPVSFVGRVVAMLVHAALHSPLAQGRRAHTVTHQPSGGVCLCSGPRGVHLLATLCVFCRRAPRRLA
jgi:hypothetical protein